jgi:hypothetical protein
MFTFPLTSSFCEGVVVQIQMFHAEVILILSLQAFIVAPAVPVDAVLKAMYHPAHAPVHLHHQIHKFAPAISVQRPSVD